MGGRGTDWFEELGNEVEAVSSSVQKPAVLRKPTRATLTPEDAMEDTETNLL